MNKLLTFAAVATFASGVWAQGMCTCNSPYGNWGLKLPFDRMNAGHMILQKEADGSASALVLWRWASPIPMKDVKVDGSSFSFTHPWDNMKISGQTVGGKLQAVVSDAKGGVIGKICGWRNPEIPKGTTSKNAKLGEPIDLLKDGLDGWVTMDPKAKFGWSFKDGVLSNKLGLKPDGSWAGGGANLLSKCNKFYDFNLSYDVRVPKGSNSGVYLRGRYEIQVVDSYGKEVDCHNMGAYYGRVTPAKAVEKPAGEWQHVDVTLCNRHLTVILNGTVILDDVPIVGITGGALDADEFVPGPIYLQGDHSDADFKNMILRPVL